MLPNLRVLLPVLCLGLLAAGGCVPLPVPGPGLPLVDGRSVREGPVLVDPTLMGSLEVGTVREDRLDSGRLRLVIPLRNLGGERLELLVKVVFKDAKGFVIPGDETPRTYVAVPRGTVHHTVTSFRSLAERFEVEIERYAP